MTWTAPFTAVAGSVLTASQVNTFIRNNLNETMPAKATTPGSILTVSGTNEIAERTPNAFSDTASVDITATSFDDPATGEPGPSCAIRTGVTALVGYRANVRVPSTTARVEMSYAITGATDRPASSSRSLGYSVSNSGSGMQQRVGVVDLATLLTPGENVFTLKYNVSSGTGVAYDRRIWVLPL